MKKSLLTIITFALVLVNLILTAIMALRVVPEVNNVNNLIAKISEAIELDIASGDEKTGGAAISIENITPYTLPDKLTVNLKKGPDGVEHYAVASVTISLNKNSEVYETYQTLDPYVGVVSSEINRILQKYTMDELRNDQEKVLDEIKNSLNTLFKSDLVAQVGFSSVNYQ